MNRSSVLRSALLTTALILAACGGGAQDGTPSGNNPDPNAMNPDPNAMNPDPNAMNPTPTPVPAIGDLCAGKSGTQGAPFEMTGTWVSRVINAQIFDGTLGKGSVVITTLSRVRATHQPGTTHVATETEVCAVELTPYNGNRTKYPPPALSAISIMQSEATLGAATLGSTYVPAQRIQLLGWSSSADPKTDPLPTMKTDPRVADRDNDGHPGASLEVDLRDDGSADGMIYIANRNIVDLNGTVIGNDCIAGRSRTEQAQNILDASTALLRLGRVTATPDPNPDRSTFEMIRAPMGVETCQQILGVRTQLFPR